MRKRKAAIYDESATDTVRTLSLLTNYDQFSQFEITTFSDTKVLLDSKINFDIVLLEIGTQNPNGYEVAQNLHSREKCPIIIFLTGDSRFVYQGYEVAQGYLQKPVSQELLNKTLDRVFHTLQAKYCIFDSNNLTYVIRLQEIRYIETSGHQVSIHTNDGCINAWRQYNKIISQLPQSTFAVPTKGFVVNLEYVSAFGTQGIALFDGTVIPVSRHFRAGFKEKLYRFRCV